MSYDFYGLFHFFHGFAHNGIGRSLTEFYTTARKFREGIAEDEFVAHEHSILCFIEQDEIGTYINAWVEQRCYSWCAGLVARSISRLPGGPGNRSTVKPAACKSRLTCPLAQ